MGAGALHPKTGVVCEAAGSCEACEAITGPGRSPAGRISVAVSCVARPGGRAGHQWAGTTPLRAMPVADNPGGAG